MTNAANARKWPEMSAVERLTWFGKFLLAMCTFGFAFPRIMEPHLKD